MRAERPVDNWRIIPPPSEGGPGRIPLGPRRRADRCARAPQKEASDGYPEGHHRDHPTTSAEGGVWDARTPASGTGRAVEHHRHCWYCCVDARYWHRRALSTTCMGYQHRRALYPPRGVNSPLTMSTTPSRCRQRAPVRDALEHPVLETRPPLTTHFRAGRATALRAHWANPSVWCHSPRVTHGHVDEVGERAGLVPLPPGYAHKDPDLRNTRCTQRLDSALVCDPVFPNSLPCVRHQEERAPRPMNPRPRQSQPRPRV